jgi:hypothetical protein
MSSDPALVAVEIAKEAGGEAAQATGVIAVRRWLDLDYVGAEVGQYDAAGWPHDGVGKFEDGQALERHHRHGNSFCLSGAILSVGGQRVKFRRRFVRTAA